MYNSHSTEKDRLPVLDCYSHASYIFIYLYIERVNAKSKRFIIDLV